MKTIFAFLLLSTTAWAADHPPIEFNSTLPGEKSVHYTATWIDIHGDGTLVVGPHYETNDGRAVAVMSLNNAPAYFVECYDEDWFLADEKPPPPSENGRKVAGYSGYQWRDYFTDRGCRQGFRKTIAEKLAHDGIAAPFGCPDWSSYFNPVSDYNKARHRR
jgi:hypothetical protein